jgi:Bicoid-interacting protein 3 (Bin3)
MKKRLRTEPTVDHPDSASSLEVRGLDASHPRGSSVDVSNSLRSDNGHRYGNFHNYYNFNPVSNRTSYMHEIFDYIIAEWNQINSSSGPAAFRYVDVGCNEGDLTLEVAKLLSQRISHTQTLTAAVESKNSTENASMIHISGMDFDLDLIQRAQAKVQQQTDLHSFIRADFQVVDVLKDGIVARSHDEISSTSGSSYHADLTSIFSTTMWLHIHGGDEGLRRVLRQVCSSTRHWILLESQPSKCYATAAFRLRRMGLEPLDVSTQRLHLRSKIEEAIASILLENSFERIILERKGQVDDDAQNIFTVKETTYERCGEAKETKTPWNRRLRLYGRVACNCNSFGSYR